MRRQRNEFRAYLDDDGLADRDFIALADRGFADAGEEAATF